jgi:hypothetical protein
MHFWVKLYKAFLFSSKFESRSTCISSAFENYLFIITIRICNMNIQDIKVSPRYNAQLKISKEFTFWLKESLFIVYMHKIVMMIQIKFAIRLLIILYSTAARSFSHLLKLPEVFCPKLLLCEFSFIATSSLQLESCHEGRSTMGICLS